MNYEELSDRELDNLVAKVVFNYSCKECLVKDCCGCGDVEKQF